MECFANVSEIVFFCKKKKINGIPCQIYFEKAYDKVNWNFLLGPLKVRGFVDNLCNWIRACLSTSKTSNF